MSTNGVVKLKSGTWSWNIHHDHGESTVRFKRSSRDRDELCVWITELELSPDAAVAAARSAEIRFWTDGFGRTWELMLEPMNRENGPTLFTGEQAGDQWLIYQSGARRIQSTVSGCVRLADIPASVLSKVLAEEESATVKKQVGSYSRAM